MFNDQMMVVVIVTGDVSRQVCSVARVQHYR